MRFNFLYRGAAIGIAAVALVATACSTDRLLQANDPDIINPADVESTLGADAVRVGALARLQTALFSSDVTNGEGIYLLGGLLADEWKSGNTFWQTDEIDQRVMRVDNANISGSYRQLHRVRTAANQALDLLKRYPATAGNDAVIQKGKVAQMYLVRGAAEMQLAESWCNGLAFSDGTSTDIKFGQPMTTQEAMTIALASFDSATAALGTDTLSVRVRDAAAIGRGRAYLWLNNYAQAKAAVQGVATTYAWLMSFSQSSGFDNGTWSINNNQKRYTVGDSIDTAPNATLEGAALPFVTAADPRVPTLANGNSFQTNMPNFVQRIWTAREQAVPIFSGLDARLIEAEADLASGQSAAYLTTLNALRTGPTRIGDPNAAITISGMGALTDPTTPALRVAQFFREKAFWTFGRGQRLGDSRRQVRQYTRPQNQVFPSGAFFKGGSFGTDMNFPIPQTEQNNPNYTTPAGSTFNGCTDRNA